MEFSEPCKSSRYTTHTLPHADYHDRFPISLSWNLLGIQMQSNAVHMVYSVKVLSASGIW